jgi:multiple sugar transport system substrate-binding protein
MRTRKLCLHVAAMVVLSLWLVACGGSGALSPSSSSGSSKGPITVAVFSGPEADAIKTLGPQFTKQTGIQVNFTSFSYDQLFSKEVQSATSAVPSYEIFFMDDPWMATFAGGGYLYPLDHFGGFDAASQGFASGALRIDQWPPPAPNLVPKGTDPKATPHYYALPTTANVTMFFYRTDLAQKYGVNPQHWTWTDVNTLAEKVKGTGVAGYVLRGDGGNDSTTDFSPILWAYGGHYFNSNWTSALNSPQALAALEEWKLLFSFGPSGEASFGADQVGNNMANGMAASAIVWPSGWADKMPSNVGITEVPGMNGNQYPEVGVWSVGIAKNSTHADEDFQFIKWLTAEVQEKQYGSAGIDLPTLQSLLLDPTLDQKFPFYKAVYQSLQDSHMRPRTPAWPHVEEALGGEIVKVELGQESPQQALQKASQEINQYMTQNNLTT